MDIETITECMNLSDQEKIAFPEVIERLAKAGVDFYYADLVSHVKTFYKCNQHHSLTSLRVHDYPLNEIFKKEGIQAAVRGAQSGKVKYQEFVKLAMAAGVFGYFVFIKGKKVVYMGTMGEEHTELFP